MGALGPEKAREICEGLLTVTGKAMLARDYETLAECFHLPHTIETPDRKTVLKTSAALRQVLERVSEYYLNRQMTDLIRIVEVAEFRGPNRIEEMYMTHMMAGDQRVADPFPCFSVLERIGDRWRITASQYAVDQDTAVGRALRMSGPELF